MNSSSPGSAALGRARVRKRSALSFRSSRIGPFDEIQPTEICGSLRDTRYKKGQVGADDGDVRDIPLLLRFTHLALATAVIDDAEDLTTLDFTPRGNRRRPDLRLHRRPAGQDQGFERGS